MAILEIDGVLTMKWAHGWEKDSIKWGKHFSQSVRELPAVRCMEPVLYLVHCLIAMPYSHPLPGPAHSFPVLLTRRSNNWGRASVFRVNYPGIYPRNYTFASA